MSDGASRSAFAGVKACVFDAYGTLFDFTSAALACEGVPAPLRAELAALWRTKQLEYTWLRSLQHRHANFADVTAAALDHTLATLGLEGDGLHADLMALYHRLAPYPEVPEVLATLRGAGLVTAILSNGTPAMLDDLLAHAGLTAAFDHVLSVEAVGVFKTDPRVYQYACTTLGLAADQIVFLSSNGWDAWAASAFGMRVIWCNRTAAPPERLPGSPDLVLPSLAGVPAAVLYR